MSQRSQFYLRESTPNTAKPKTQASYAERRQRAKNLMDRINQLRKPPHLEGLSMLTDVQKIIQLLHNTQHIQAKTNQMGMGEAV